MKNSVKKLALIFCHSMMLILFSTFLFLKIGVSTSYASRATWYDNAWGYRRSITITNSNNSLTNYRVRITLNSSNFDFSKPQTSGQDIRFTASDGVTLLNYWIESYDSTAQTASIYVNVPTVSTGSATTIYLYYGNSQVFSNSNLKSAFATTTYDQAFVQSAVTAGTSYESFNSAERLQNGNIVVAYRLGTTHGSTDGSIKLATSTDNGTTWTTTTAVANASLDLRVQVGLKQISDGTLLLPYYQNVPATASFLIKSTDNGATWSAPIAVTSSSLNKNVAAYGKIIELSNGNLLMPVYGQNTGENWRAALFQSTDKGSTWTFKSTIAYDGVTDYYEPSVINVDDNNLVAIVRKNTTPNSIVELTSSDGGSTWSSINTTPFSSNTTYGVSPDIQKLSNGHLLVTIANRYCCTQTSQRPQGVVGYISTDNGASWGYEIPIYLGSRFESHPHNTGNMGYPSSIQMADGSIQTYFYHAMSNADITRIDKVVWKEGTDYTLADDFEKGNVNMWSTVGDTTDVSSNFVRDGSYALRMQDQDTTVLNQAFGRIFGVRQNNFLVNFWINPQSTEISFGLNDGEYSGTNAVRFNIFQSSSSSQLQYYNGISYVSFSTPVSIPFNTWTKVGLKYTQTDDQVELFINNVSYGKATAWKTGSVPDWLSVDSGSTSGTGTDFYIDDVFAQTYAATEPSSTIGNEEDGQLLPIISITNLPIGLPDGKIQLSGSASTGNSSTIRTVEYSVNGGSWIGATPTDGSFDSSSENFSFNFSPNDNNYLGDGYVVKIQDQSSTGLWQSTLYFSPFLLNSPSDQSFSSNPLPTFTFSVNKGRFDDLANNLDHFRISLNKNNSGWISYIDNIPVSYRDVQNNPNNLQASSLSTNGNGVYEDKYKIVRYSNNNSTFAVTPKTVDVSGNQSDAFLENGGSKLSTGTYQWKVQAIDRAGNIQETAINTLRIGTHTTLYSRNWFPLTISSLSGLHLPNLSTISPQRVNSSYKLYATHQTIRGIAVAGTTVSFTVTDLSCTQQFPSCSQTFQTTAQPNSRYSFSFPQSLFRKGRRYSLDVSVRDSGNNYSELPTLNIHF